MKQFLVRRWFLLALGLVMAVGLMGYQGLFPLADCVPLRYSVVATVLFLMALPLDAKTMWRTLRRPHAPALGVLMNSLALPALTWLVVATLGVPLFGPELSPGLLVAAATPCTLASAAVWTRRAGGNDAASILVTVLTNASCFLVTPFWLLQMTGQQAKLDASQMITKLSDDCRAADDSGTAATSDPANWPLGVSPEDAVGGRGPDGHSDHGPVRFCANGLSV